MEYIKFRTTGKTNILQFMETTYQGLQETYARNIGNKSMNCLLSVLVVSEEVAIRFE